MSNIEQRNLERKNLMAQMRKVKLKMIGLLGEGTYLNFITKVKTVNKLNSFIESVKALNQDFPVPPKFLNTMHAMENSPFNGVALPSKAPDLLALLEEELEIVRTNIRNYLDVNPKFAELYNEMVTAYTTHKPTLS